MKSFEQIKQLVGNVSLEQLRFVDYAVTDKLGIFMPVAGQCFYAISPEHSHPSYLITVAFDSYCRIKIQGKTFTSVPSTMVLIPPDLPHQELPSEVVSRYMAVMIDKEFFQNIFSIYSPDHFPVQYSKPIKINDRLIGALKEFIAEYEEKTHGFTHMLSASAQTITHLIIRLFLNLSRENEKISSRMSVNKAVEFIYAHYGSKMSLTDLAHTACLSPSHFTRVFKTETGLSPSDYIMKTRLDIAKRMLRAGDNSVTEIAMHCGFNSTSYFSNCFVKAFNISPSLFKKSLK